MSDEAGKRRDELADQADYHARALRRRRESESAQAQALIDTFVAEAQEAGLATEELVARPWSGGGHYRTGVVGWHLRHDRSIGVGLDGAFYVLVVAPQRFGRWRTVRIEPTSPPLQPGMGARDGESASLKELLELRMHW
jgi:hypothetical protein